MLLSAGVYGAAYLIAMALHPTLAFALGTWGVLTAALALWNAADLRRYRLPAPLAALPAPGGKEWPWVLPVLLLGWIAMLAQGGSLGYVHDSLDYAGYVNRMLHEGRIDLVSGSFKDVAGLTPDPRRGAFHLAGAFLCRLSGVTPVEMWRAFPTFLVPLALWVFYAAARRLLQSARSAFAALLFFVGATFFTGDHFINNLAYASRLGWVYSWTGLWAAALYLDREKQDNTPPPDWRPWRATGPEAGRPVLGLVILAAPILLGIHILSAAQYLLSLAAFTWTWALSPLEPRPVRRALLLLPLLAAVALLPLLLLKLGQSYSAANPLFDHPQGLLYLGDGWAVLSPAHLAAWYGWPGLLGLLAALPLLPRVRRDRTAAYLVGSTLLPLLIVLNPIAIRVIEGAKAHSLLFRVLLVAPCFQVLGWWTVWAARRLAGRRRVVPALVFLAALAATFGLHFRSASQFWATPEQKRAAWGEMPELITALRFLDDTVRTPAVVASDPITSYMIPAYTRHFVITPFDQHSSPADDRTVERIQDAHGILSAYVPLRETLRLLRKHGTEYILLNQSFPYYQKTYYTLIAPGTYELQREKFRSRPEIFAPVYGAGTVFLYRFLDPGTETAGDGLDPPNPHLALPAGEAEGASREALSARFDLDPFPGAPVGGLELVGARPDSAVYHRGSPMSVRTLWRRGARPLVLPVSAFLRIQTTYPSALFDSPVLGKPYRFWYEARHRAHYRWGRDREPLAWIFPPYLWEPGAAYREEISLTLPYSLQPGEYDVRIRLHEVPCNPNFRLSDLLRLDDSLNGVVIGRITVR